MDAGKSLGQRVVAMFLKSRSTHPPSRSDRRLRGRSAWLLCGAVVGLTALTAPACSLADDSSDGAAASTALVALSTAQSAQATAEGVAASAAAQAQMAEMALNLALATADLAQAVAVDDPAMIAAAAAAVGAASEAARQALGRVEEIAAAQPASLGETAGAVRGPGAGVEVRMARANWSSGYMQAAILRSLLEELDYTVGDPAAATLTPADFYPMLARGELDFWGHGWFPSHDQYLFAEDLAIELPEGGGHRRLRQRRRQGDTRRRPAGTARRQENRRRVRRDLHGRHRRQPRTLGQRWQRVGRHIRL